MMTRVALLVLAACGATGPEVTINVNPLPTADAHYIVAGARSWRALGFEVVEASNLPDCDRRWYEGADVDCSIHVVVDRAPIVDSTGTEYAGYADRSARRIVLSTRLAADTYDHRIELWAVAAHEFGHVLLDAGEHLPPGTGVMSTPPIGVDPTAADLELACTTIEVCL